MPDTPEKPLFATAMPGRTAAPVVQATGLLRNARLWLHMMAKAHNLDSTQTGLLGVDPNGNTVHFSLYEFLGDLDAFLGDRPSPELDIRSPENTITKIEDPEEKAEMEQMLRDAAPQKH